MEENLSNRCNNLYSMQNYSDQQLVAAYLKGDQKALEVLIRRYLGLIYRFVFSYVNNAACAQDVTQETFLKAWRNIKKFDQQKTFKTWLYVIAKNTAIDFTRKKTDIPFSTFENNSGQNPLIDNLVDESWLPDRIAQQINAKDILALAMEKLSLKYRKILSLYYQKNYNLREISQMLREPLNTVKSRHRRGLAHLRQYISQ